MTTTIFLLLQRIVGWRLNLLIIVLTVALTDVVVAFVDWVLLGRVGPDSMLVSTVSGLIIATMVVSAVGAVRGRIARMQQLNLEQGIERAQSHLSVAIEATQMVFWELDLVTWKLHFDHGKISWLGITSGTQIDSISQWMVLVHPDDYTPFMQCFQAALPLGAADFIFDYRIQQATGDWGWVHTHGRVKERNAQGESLVAVGSSLNINQRKQAEAALRYSETLLRTTLASTDEGILMVGQGGQVLSANQRFLELWHVPNELGTSGRDELLLAHMMAQLSNPDIFISQVKRLNGNTEQERDTLHFKDGRVFARFTRALQVGGQQGRIWCFKDITDQTQARQQLERSLNLIKTVIDTAPVRIFWKGLDLRYLGCNPIFAKDAGLSCSDDLIGKLDSELSWHAHASEYMADDRKVMDSGVAKLSYDEKQTTPDGRLIWLRTSKAPLFGQKNELIGVLGMYEDITDKKHSAELIWTQANFDTLTGLPNRRMFLDRLAQGLKKAHRGGLKLALMFLDLDRFKEINDTLGHGIGDELLVEAARRIAACTRESDTVARIGGDEFTVILTDLTDASGIDRIANDILSVLSQPFALGREQAYVSVSIGITLYPDDALSQEDLLKNADQAMYVSKGSGRNRFSYFTRAMQDAAQHRQHLLSDLRCALAQNQFELHYQPIVDLHSGQIHKAEALLRWTHPVRGQVGPAEFIALAEESGLIHELGDWVFAQATQQVQRWRTSICPDFQVSVNVSPVQIQSGSDPLQWQRHLQAIQLGGDAVVLEITEGLLLDKSPVVTNELLAYRDAGIQVAIDDFGTGYSALAYLKRLDIDYLKIDRSFVHNMAADSSDHALCEAIVVVAHKLGLKVIAEGVETAQQRDLLQAMGCDFAQGFLYAKALPALAFEQLLQKVSHSSSPSPLLAPVDLGTGLGAYLSINESHARQIFQ